MKSAIIAALIGSAAAFAPAPLAQTTSAINAFEDELGAQPPLGFFDPFGLLAGDVTQERFDRLRDVEIKHGRICQLAFLGQIVTRAGLHLAGNIDYSGDSFDSFLVPQQRRRPHQTQLHPHRWPCPADHLGWIFGNCRDERY